MVIGQKQGVEFKIRNAGGNEIPPFQVVMYHPLRGSATFLRAENENEPLLPSQLRIHSCPLLENGKPVGYLKNWMMFEKNETATNPKIDEFVFQIKINNSERILFESSRIGRAYARTILRTFENLQVGSGTWEESQEMSTQSSVIRKSGIGFA